MQSEILTAVYSQHTVYLQRLGATQGNAIIPYLSKIEEGIQRVFNRYRDRAKTKANQAAIQKAINEISKEQLKLYVVELKKSNREIGIEEAQLASATMRNVIENDDFETVIPTAAQVNAVAVATPIHLGGNSYTTYKTMTKNYWQKWSNEIDSAVQAGFVSGQTINEIADNVFSEMRLQKSTTSKNILNRALRSAKSIAITGTNHYANTSRIEFVNQNDDMIKGYRLIAVVDSRTSKQCRSLDQKYIAKDSPKLSAFTPPLHINCRTALVYEVADKFKLDDKDTKRASSFEVDGKRDPKQVSSEGIYYEQMKRNLKKAKDQDNILGRTLGKAFRKLNDPKAFADATIDSLGNPLTIKQMREKNDALGNILKEIERKKKEKKAKRDTA